MASMPSCSVLACRPAPAGSPRGRCRAATPHPAGSGSARPARARPAPPRPGRREERRVAQQHADMRRLGQDPAGRAAAPPGAAPSSNVVAPADKRTAPSAPTECTPRSSTSVSGANSSETVGVANGRSHGSDGRVGQFPADDQQLPGGAAHRELGLLGGQKIPVHGVVGVDADTAVHVYGGVCDAVSGLGRPERRASARPRPTAGPRTTATRPVSASAAAPLMSM